MPDFGEEFIIESYKIPWLIWIQLLVMILLVILLFFRFSIFNSDASSSSSFASASTGGGGGSAPPTYLNQPSSSQRRIKVQVLGAAHILLSPSFQLTMSIRSGQVNVAPSLSY
ncbi:hypothetical protein ACS0TY_027842 [Phlomoides rotata]